MKFERIYALVDPRDHRIRYVGRTECTLKDRLAFNKGEIYNWRTMGRPKNRWLRELRDLKLSPAIVLLEDAAVGQAAQAERFWVETLIERGAKLMNVAYARATK